jgi:hypothetical protein
VDEKLSPSVAQRSPLSFISHKMTWPAFREKPLISRPTNMESSFPSALHFSTLYLDGNKKIKIGK